MIRDCINQSHVFSVHIMVARDNKFFTIRRSSPLPASLINSNGAVIAHVFCDESRWIFAALLRHDSRGRLGEGLHSFVRESKGPTPRLLCARVRGLRFCRHFRQILDTTTLPPDAFHQKHLRLSTDRQLVTLHHHNLVYHDEQAQTHMQHAE